MTEFIINVSILQPKAKNKKEKRKAKTSSNSFSKTKMFFHVRLFGLLAFLVQGMLQMIY